MEDIKITIENYKGKKLIFTAPENAIVNILKTKAVAGKDKGKLIDVRINFVYDGIDFKEENTND